MQHRQSPRPARSQDSPPACATHAATQRSCVSRARRACLLGLTCLLCALLPACASHDLGQGPDLDALRAAVLAHELGHAIGLQHTRTGLMHPTVPRDALPTPADFEPWTGYVDCLNWSVPDDLRDAFETAAEAWCIASDGKFCPWVYDTTDAPCTVTWDDLGANHIGMWRPHKIRVDPSLR